MKGGMVLHSVLLVALAAGGVSTGRWLRHSPVVASSQEEKARADDKRTRKGRSATPSATPVAPHDLAALRRFAASAPEEESEAARQMVRVPTPELKAMVLSVFAKIGPDQPRSEKIACHRTIMHACQELYQRDGRAAYDWAAALSPEDLCVSACSTMLTSAARQDPALTEELGKNYQEKHGDGILSTMQEPLLRGYLEKGDMAAIARLVADYGDYRPICPSIHFPENFDFSALLKALDGKTEITGPLLHWGMRDPDAAWTYIMEHHPSGKVVPESQINMLNNLFHAAVLRDGSEKGVAWTLEKISALSPEQRNSFLGDLKLQAMAFPPEAVASFVGALSATDRQTVVSAMREGRFHTEGYAQKYLGVLGILPREEMLAELADVYQSNRDAFESPGDEAGGGFTRTTEKIVRHSFNDAEKRFRLTPEELVRIRGGGE